MRISITENQFIRLIAESYDVEYTFNKFGVSSNYAKNYVFFNDSKLINGKLDGETEIVVFLRKDGEEFQFLRKDINISKNGVPYISLQDFTKEYEKQGYELGKLIDDEKNSVKSNNTPPPKNEIVADPLSETNQRFLRKNISEIPSTILESIRLCYPNNWGKISDKENGCETNLGLLDLYPAVEGERWSILNFFDTNPLVIRTLTQEFLDKNEDFTIKDFIKWIEDNRQDLFGESSSFLKELINKNKSTFDSGAKRENNFVDHLEKDYNIEPSDITTFCLGSIEDRVNSRDVKIRLSNKDIYFQVKPLYRITKKTVSSDGKQYFEVSTSGMKDTYKRQSTINYISYSSNQESIIFPNSHYSVINNGKTVLHYLPPITVLK
jgi:hypothetical protein